MTDKKIKDRVLCSTGTVIGRLNGFDYTLLSEYSKNINCGGFEFMIEPFWKNEEKINEIAGFLSPLGINFAALHMDKNIGELISKNGSGDIGEALRVFELNCKAASRLGSRLLVLHLWGGTASDKNIEVNIKTCSKLLEIAGRYNLILTIENVVCNTHNALAHMENLYKIYKNSIKFTIDVRHAAFHGMLKETCETGFLWENGLVLHFHIADYRGKIMDWSNLRPVLPPGDGDIDFSYLSDFLKEIDYAGSLTLEASGSMSETGLDYKKLNNKLDFICNLFL
jgi:sugar phosphate isomerase/epimerase